MTEVRKILEVENLTKRFPGVIAIDDVSFCVEAGETLALLGENGAGKSTLTQMLSGVLSPDTGRIMLDGEEVHFHDASDAIGKGVSMVFQELSLVGGLSVAENIFADRQPTTPLGTIKWTELYAKTAALLQQFELDVDPRLPVKYLSVGQQQMLEILKAVSSGPKLLLLDEPTSSLTEPETDHLFGILRRLKLQGMSFIYITHKLSEVFRLADQVMVLRDGCFIDKVPLSGVDEEALVAMMVGRNISQLYGGERETSVGEAFFYVDALSGNGFSDIRFSLRHGEILGIAGLIGAGRTEMARAIIGADPKTSGTITLDDSPLRIDTPADAIRHKIAYLTEDRKGLGLFLDMTIKENLVANRLRAFASSVGAMKDRQVTAYAEESVRNFKIATPSIEQKMFNLSGGNQQKALIAEWLGIEPRIIIFDEPTRGVDVGARADIYQKIKEYADRGGGVIIISSELPELLGMCERILVMHQGRVTGEIEKQDFSEERIMALAAGVARA